MNTDKLKLYDKNSPITDHKPSFSHSMSKPYYQTVGIWAERLICLKVWAQKNQKF